MNRQKSCDSIVCTIHSSMRQKKLGHRKDRSRSNLFVLTEWLFTVTVNTTLL